MRKHNLFYTLIAAIMVASFALSACAPAATPTTAPTTMEQPTTPPVAPTTVMEATQPPAEATTVPTAMAPTTAAAGSQVEVFSWWVGPGEADGLAAMVKVFEAKYPNIKFVNAAVAGGAGTNAKAVLATRLAANDPPDSWQAHAGQETIATFVTAKQVAPLDDLFASTGFASVLPKTLLPLISQDGHPYSVPVNIHRSNVLWYSPKVLQAAGVTANPKTDFKTWDAFFAVCDKIKAAGKTCLALGAPWTAVHLFENVVIGTIGADKWSGLWATPPTTDWKGADVKKALANYAKALSYTNSDASTMSDWQPAAKLVADGDAAFNVMGDWAYGYFANPAPNGLALKPHTDFDWAVSPGTYGIFNFLSDSFVLPANAKHPDATIAWLTVAASKEGQEAFNPLKGSICARTDCDPTKFSEYSQDAAKDWASNQVVGSLFHGVVAAPAWVNKISTAIGLFQASKMDAAAQSDLQKALADACASDGTCK
ncbi:MAG: extracellular solute-binding protein [Anaerolineaceae bacterium]|nr:extracellular solute-binding protein [Anaerolineaceae bacterium]